MTDLTETILRGSYTKADALDKLRAVHGVVEHRLFGGKSEEDQRYIDFLGSLSDQFYGQFNQSNFGEVFSQAEKELREIEPLVVYLARDLPQERIALVGERLRQDYGSSFLLEVKVDPALLGGCALVWKGRYKDYSLRAKVAEKRNLIVEIIAGMTGENNLR